MAARVATSAETLASLHDASSVYEQFFEPVRAQCPPLQDSASLRTLAAVALFGRLFLDRPEQMLEVAHLHGLTAGEFTARLDALHDAELIDRYENAVVRVSDQVLVTYIVYLVLFKRNLIDLRDTLERLYPLTRNSLLEQLGAVARTFRQPAVADRLEGAVHAVWDQAEQTWPSNTFELFVLHFASVRPRQAVQIAIRRLAAEGPDPVPADLRVVVSHQENINDSPTLLLGRFRHDPGLRPIALNALVDEAERHPTRIPALLRLLWESYGFSRHSIWGDLEPEHALFDVLWSRAADGRSILPARMFVALAGYVLRTQHDEHESGRGNSFTMYRFDLPNAEGVRRLRCAIWARLLRLLQVLELRGAVLEVIRHFATAGSRVADRALVRLDLATLDPGLLPELVPDRGTDIAVARALRHLRQRLRLGVPRAYAPLLASPLGRFAELVLRDHIVWGQRGWRAAGAIRVARLSAYSSRLAGDFDAFAGLVAALLIAYEERDAWQIRAGATIVLHEAALHWPVPFAAWFARMLAEDNPLQFQPAPLVHAAIQALGLAGAHALVAAAPAASRAVWLRAWFERVPHEQWSAVEADACASLIEQALPHQISRSDDLIDRVCVADFARGTALLQHLAQRARTEPDVGLAITDGFSDSHCMQRPIGGVFRADPAVLEALYLAADAIDAHIDQQAEVFSELITLRPGFSTRWVEYAIAREEADPRRDDPRLYTTLWRRADWHVVMGAMCEAAISNEQASWYHDSYLHTLLRMTDDIPDAAELAGRQDALLAELIGRAAGHQEHIERLFAGIALLPAGRRARLIGRYLATTPSVQQFERLMLEPNRWTYEGSRVPTLDRRRAFVSELLAYCDRPELLDHGAVLEARLRLLDADLVDARRDDFVGR